MRVGVVLDQVPLLVLAIADRLCVLVGRRGGGNTDGNSRCTGLGLGRGHRIASVVDDRLHLLWHGGALRNVGLVKHLPHDSLHLRPLQDVVRRRPLVGVPIQHLRAELPHKVGVGVRDHWDWAPDDLLHEAGDVRGIEGDLQGSHLVEDAAHRPDVGRPRVGLLLADLGAQVVRRPDLCLGACYGGGKDLRDTEVAHLQDVLGEEEVAGLQVAVQDVPVVDVLQRQQTLREPSEDLVLGEGLATFSGLVYLLGEVPVLAEVHQDAEPAAVGEVLPVPDDVRVLERG
mmetsp:Transcript_54094/g.142496  ORF Transcript_54094/g.142496 Transcript_54094/m.142496 type:complete len:286 (-) Transcript_54094:313-1170(-)